MEDRKDKLPKPETEESRGKQGKNDPPEPSIWENTSSYLISDTTIESVRDWPSDGPCDPFRKKSNDD